MNSSTTSSSKRKRNPPGNSSPSDPPAKRARSENPAVKDVPYTSGAPDHQHNPALPQGAVNTVETHVLETAPMHARVGDESLSIESHEQSLFGPFETELDSAQPPPTPCPVDTAEFEQTSDPIDVKTTEIGAPAKRKRKSKPAPRINALFWQDSEITGGYVDQTDPDDDGNGLDGVGFELPRKRADAASRTRKQQIAQWKAAVLKESREERSNRRATGGAPTLAPVREDASSSLETTPRKAVRFVDG